MNKNGRKRSAFLNARVVATVIGYWSKNQKYIAGSNNTRLWYPKNLLRNQINMKLF